MDNYYKLPQYTYEPDTQVYFDGKDDIEDSEWFKLDNLPSIDGVSSDEDSDDNFAYLIRTGADFETMDTSVGGHIALNPPYSFTMYADLPRKGRLDTREDMDPRNIDSKVGMGRKWYEMFQSNMQPRILFLTFGVPQFQSMFSFYSRSITYREAVIAREGRNPFFYYVGAAIGEVTKWVLYPAFTAGMYALQAFRDIAFGLPDPQYYTVKTTMDSYWKVVNNIVSMMLVERGVAIPILEKVVKKNKYGVPVSIDKTFLKDLQKLLPNVILDDGNIDVSAIVGRYQRMVNAQLESEYEFITSFTGKNIKKSATSISNAMKDDKLRASYEKFTKTRMEEEKKNKESLENKKAPKANTADVDPKKLNTPDKEGFFESIADSLSDWYKNYKSYYNAYIQEGALDVKLYTEYVKPGTDTFANTSADIPVKGILNTVGAKARQIEFSLSDGNVIGDMVDSVVKSARDVVAGTLSRTSFGLSNVIMGLTMGGAVTMPKMYNDSNHQIATHTLKIHLGGPSGSEIDRIMDIDIPLATILAGVLPLGVGDSGYMSPFLCKARMRGVMDIWGMISNVTIERGPGSLSQDHKGAPLSIDVTITIEDYSDVMAPRIHNGANGIWAATLDEFNPLNTYLSLIAGKPLDVDNYMSKRISYRLSKMWLQAEKYFSPSSVAMMASETVFGEINRAIAKDLGATTLFSSE